MLLLRRKKTHYLGLGFNPVLVYGFASNYPTDIIFTNVARHHKCSVDETVDFKNGFFQ